MPGQPRRFHNQGYTATEIAATIELPEALDKVWYTRQYYGTLRHNVRAVSKLTKGYQTPNAALMLHGSQTTRDKLGGQKGNSPDLQLRSQSAC